MRQPSSAVAPALLARLAFDSNGLALVLVGPDGRVAAVNAAAARDLAIPAEQLVGRPLPATVPPERLQTLAEGEGHRLVLLTGGPWKDEGGRMKDESEEGPSGSAFILHPSSFAAPADPQSVQVLAGGVAHTFNNLLTTVLGYASLAGGEPGLSPTVRSCLQQIEQAARQAADVCRRLLAHAGGGQLVVEPVDFNAVVRDHAAILRLTAPATAELSLQLAGSLPAVEADAAQLGSVVVYLLTNAVEALEGRPGKVLVRTVLERLPPERLAGLRLGAGLPEGHYVCLEVSDTGVGMDEATAARIFEPFFSTKFAGRGLSLAAAHGIVRSHRGALEVQTGPGQGATFRLYFPTAGAEAPAAGRRGPLDEAWRSGGKVLVADDEEGVRRFACTVLQMHGLETLEAGNGLEALAVLDGRRAEVLAVLLDLTMPQLDGGQALDEIRRRWPDLPVVLMSGYGERDVAARFAGKGLAGFLQKPFTHAELEAALAHAIAGCGPRVAD
jgi:signal transduction histidine kinase/ActR/RegA family two-component response regulator